MNAFIEEYYRRQYLHVEAARFRLEKVNAYNTAPRVRTAALYMSVLFESQLAELLETRKSASIGEHLSIPGFKEYLLGLGTRYCFLLANGPFEAHQSKRNQGYRTFSAFTLAQSLSGSGIEYSMVKTLSELYNTSSSSLQYGMKGGAEIFSHYTLGSFLKLDEFILQCTNPERKNWLSDLCSTLGRIPEPGDVMYYSAYILTQGVDQKYLDELCLEYDPVASLSIGFMFPAVFSHSLKMSLGLSEKQLEHFQDIPITQALDEIRSSKLEMKGGCLSATSLLAVISLLFHWRG